MLSSAPDTFSFYFNYDYGIDSTYDLRWEGMERSLKDNETYVKHIVDTFYKNDLGKIVKVHDMISECGRFFIITFNKETWNWNNPKATTIYNTGFPPPVDTWGPGKHIMIKDETVLFRTPIMRHPWIIYLTSFPDIDEKPELFGEWCYDINWSINEYDEEYETFEIKMSPCVKEKLSDSVDVKNEVVYDNRDPDKWKHWGGDNTWDDDDTQIAIAREKDIDEWLTTDENETDFYENWANELDAATALVGMKNSGNSGVQNTAWKSNEYRYDLSDIAFTGGIGGKYGYTPGNGYTAYTKAEFIAYYGADDGEMRWYSDIYSAHCSFADETYYFDLPEGCKMKYNISYLLLKLCVFYDNENDFNIGRSILRKYVDSLWSLTDPTDDDKEQKPVINLRADYNSNTFNASCWYEFKYTDLRYNQKCIDVETLVKNFKSWHSPHQLVDPMIEWIPSAE
jgi:hypothetical protein